MSDVILPNRNITGDNLWSQVESNDQAIVNTINGDLDDGNIAGDANISGSKFADASIDGVKLKAKTVTGNNMADDSVDSVAANLSFVDTHADTDVGAIPADGIKDALTSENLPGGQYLLVASGYVSVTKNNIGSVYLQSVGFRLCTNKVYADASGVDILMPFSLTWVGTIANGYPVVVQIEAGSSGAIVLKTGSRISAVRIG